MQKDGKILRKGLYLYFFANWANCANVENVMFALFVGANVVQTIFSFCSVIAKTLCPEQLNRWWPCLSSFTPRVFTQLQSYHRHLLDTFKTFDQSYEETWPGLTDLTWPTKMPGTDRQLTITTDNQQEIEKDKNI